MSPNLFTPSGLFSYQTASFFVTLGFGYWKNAVQDGFSFATNNFRPAEASSSAPVLYSLVSRSAEGLLFSPPGWFFVASSWVMTCVFAAIGIARKLQTVVAKISLALSSTSAPVKGNVKPRSSQQSGWSCHAKEQTRSNFYKFSRFNNWFMLNIFFASAAVDSELGVEDFIAVLKDLLF